MALLSWKNTALVVVYDVVLAVVVGVIAINVTPWALLGLIFIAGTTDSIRIELKNGTVIEAAGNDAIEAVERVIKECEG